MKKVNGNHTIEKIRIGNETDRIKAICPSKNQSFTNLRAVSQKLLTKFFTKILTTFLSDKF